MSTYTTQVRWLIEQLTLEHEDDKTIYERIDLACPLIFDFTFPLWNENYRLELERKILKHYFNKEIGLETVALWKMYLNERLNLIMPYYNKLYETTTQDFDMRWDVNITELYSGNYSDSGTGSVSSQGTAGRTNTHNDSDNTLESDYPQANYAGVDYGTKKVEHSNTGGYTNSDTSSSSGTSSKSENGTDAHTKTQQGWRYKTPAELIMLYRKTLINIDEMIINDLADLFMTIY